MSRRSRATLHPNHLPDFRKWLETEGWSEKPTKGFWEVLRARKGKEIAIWHRRSRGDHLTAHGVGLRLVEAFLRSRK